MKEAVKKTGSVIMEGIASIDPRDVFMVLGLAALAFGAFMIYQPAGLIAPAIVLLYISLFHRGDHGPTDEH